jgi:GGDEF domain-containing protein
MDRPDGRVICALLSVSLATGLAARIGGDEFAMILIGVDELFVRADRAMYDAKRAVRRAPVRAA